MEMKNSIKYKDRGTAMYRGFHNDVECRGLTIQSLPADGKNSSSTKVAIKAIGPTGPGSAFIEIAPEGIPLLIAHLTSVHAANLAALGKSQDELKHEGDLP